MKSLVITLQNVIQQTQMKSYWIRLHQIECSSPSRSSSALIVQRQDSLPGPKTRLFKTTLAGWWYFLLVCPRATARLQLKSTLFPPRHILKREHYWRVGAGLTHCQQLGKRLVQTYSMCICVFVRVCASNKASRSWQHLAREDRERRESRSTLPFLFSLLEKMSACISLFSCWHKTQPHTHTHTLTLTHIHKPGRYGSREEEKARNVA